MKEDMRHMLYHVDDECLTKATVEKAVRGQLEKQGKENVGFSFGENPSRIIGKFGPGPRECTQRVGLEE